MRSSVRHSIFIIATISLFLLCSLKSGHTQVFINGIVIDHSTDAPLVGASVYFNGTTIGTFSDSKGNFELPFDPLFTEIVVSFLGYTTITHIIPTSDINRRLKFILIEKAEQLDEVGITSTRTKSWENNLYRFKSSFIGFTRFGTETKLLNPEVMYFDKDADTNTLKAYARAPLKLENNALGYAIEYDLGGFSYQYGSGKLELFGYSRFTQLEGPQRKMKKWKRNKQSAYHGSLTHFIHSLSEGKLSESGFEIRQMKRIPNPDRPDDDAIENARQQLRLMRKAETSRSIKIQRDSLSNIVSKAGLPKFLALLDKNLYDPISNNSFEKETMRLEFNDLWQITYLREDTRALFPQSIPPGISRNSESQISNISLTTPYAAFDKYGLALNPLSILIEGYWTFEKTPYLLPLDYIRDQTLAQD